MSSRPGWATQQDFASNWKINRWGAVWLRRPGWLPGYKAVCIYLFLLSQVDRIKPCSMHLLSQVDQIKLCSMHLLLVSFSRGLWALEGRPGAGIEKWLGPCSPARNEEQVARWLLRSLEADIQQHLCTRQGNERLQRGSGAWVLGAG